MFCSLSTQLNKILAIKSTEHALQEIWHILTLWNLKIKNVPHMCHSDVMNISETTTYSVNNINRAEQNTIQQ